RHARFRGRRELLVVGERGLPKKTSSPRVSNHPNTRNVAWKGVENKAVVVELLPGIGRHACSGVAAGACLTAPGGGCAPVSAVRVRRTGTPGPGPVLIPLPCATLARHPGTTIISPHHLPPPR